MQTTVADPKAGPPWRYRVVVKKSTEQHGGATLVAASSFSIILALGIVLPSLAASFGWATGWRDLFTWPTWATALAALILLVRTFHLQFTEEQSLVEEVAWDHTPPREWLYKDAPYGLIPLPAADGSLPPMSPQYEGRKLPRTRLCYWIVNIFGLTWLSLNLAQQTFYTPPPAWKELYFWLTTGAGLAFYAALASATLSAAKEEPPDKREKRPCPDPGPTPSAPDPQRLRARAWNTAAFVAAALALESLAMAYGKGLGQAAFPWLPAILILAAALIGARAFALHGEAKSRRSA